jgi:hypothetical protein
MDIKAASIRRVLGVELESGLFEAYSGPCSGLGVSDA